MMSQGHANIPAENYRTTRFTSTAGAKSIAMTRRHAKRQSCHAALLLKHREPLARALFVAWPAPPRPHITIHHLWGHWVHGGPRSWVPNALPEARIVDLSFRLHSLRASQDLSRKARVIRGAFSDRPEEGRDIVSSFRLPPLADLWQQARRVILWQRGTRRAASRTEAAVQRLAKDAEKVSPLPAGHLAKRCGGRLVVVSRWKLARLSPALQVIEPSNHRANSLILELRESGVVPAVVGKFVADHAERLLQLLYLLCGVVLCF